MSLNISSYDFIFLFLLSLSIIIPTVFIAFFLKRKILNKKMVYEKKDVDLSKLISDDDTLRIESGDELLFEISLHKTSKNKITNRKIPKVVESTIISQIIPICEKFFNVSRNSYIVKFPADVAKKLRSGTYHLMKNAKTIKAVAVNSKTGKFASIATIESFQMINPITAAIGIWQILAAITLQKYLHDMDNKLNTLIEETNDIKNKIDNNRIGKLVGNIRYIQNLYNLISTHNISMNDVNRYLIQLENIDRESIQIMNAFFLDMKHQIDKFVMIPEEDLGKSGLKKRTEDIKAVINNYFELSKPIYMAFYSLFLSIQIRNILPIESNDISFRFKQLQKQLDENLLLHSSYFRETEKKLQSLKGFCTSKKTNEKKRNEIKDLFNNRLEESENETIKIKDMFKENKKSYLQIEEDQSNSIELLLDFDGTDYNIKELL